MMEEKMARAMGQLFPSANKADLRRLMKVQRRYNCATCPTRRRTLEPVIMKAIDRARGAVS